MSNKTISNKRKELYYIGTVMLAASLSVIIPLTLFENVAVVFVLYYLVMCIAVPIADLIILKRLNFIGFLRLIGFTKTSIKNSLLIGFGHGFIFFSLTIGGFLIFKSAFINNDIVKILARWGISNNNKWIVFILMVLFNGIVEEVFWRGYTFAKIKDCMNKWLAIGLVTLFYTSYHLTTILAFLGFSYLSLQIISAIFIAGLVWGWMRFYFNSIWASTIGHTLTTLGYMIVFLSLL